MDEATEIEFEQPLEEEVEVIELPPAQRRLYTEQGDPEIDSLYGKYKKGKLVIQPDFQRQFVWDAAKASRLMESALLEIPLPAIYLSEERDGKEYVIDGQQRLTSFLRAPVKFSPSVPVRFSPADGEENPGFLYF